MHKEKELFLTATKLNYSSPSKRSPRAGPSFFLHYDRPKKKLEKQKVRVDLQEVLKSIDKLPVIKHNKSFSPEKCSEIRFPLSERKVHKPMISLQSLEIGEEEERVSPFVLYETPDLQNLRGVIDKTPDYVGIDAMKQFYHKYKKMGNKQRSIDNTESASISYLQHLEKINRVPHPNGLAKRKGCNTHIDKVLCFENYLFIFF
jgi:hypothetical protein